MADVLILGKLLVAALAAAALPPAGTLDTVKGQWVWNPSKSVAIGAPPESFKMTVERDDPGFMSYTVQIMRAGRGSTSHFEGAVDGQPHPLSPTGTQAVSRAGPHSFHIVSVASGVTADRVCTLEDEGRRFVCRGEARMGEQRAPYVDTFDRVA